MAPPGQTNLDNLIREVSSLAQQQDAAFAAAAAPMPAGAIEKAIAFPIGTAVLDLVTGQHGVVIDGKRENVLIPPAANNGG
jgi:hypothetical protein